MNSSPIKIDMGAREWAMLIALSGLWGGSFLFVGVAVRDLPPLTIVVLRVGLGALALLGVLRVLDIALPREARVWSAFACMGLVNNALPFTLIAWGQGHVASGVASIFNATTPLFGVIVAHFWTSDEQMTPGRLVGVVVGFAGVVVMMGGGGTPSAPGALNLAQAAFLAAALLYAIAGVYGRRFKAMDVEPLATAAGMLIASTVILLPVMLIVDRPWTLPWPGLATIASIFGLALLATALAFILYFRLLAAAGATNLLLVTFLIPVTAIVLGAVLLDETLEAKHFAGMALIGLGLAAIDGRPLAAVRRRAIDLSGTG